MDEVNQIYELLLGICERIEDIEIDLYPKNYKHTTSRLVRWQIILSLPPTSKAREIQKYIILSFAVREDFCAVVQRRYGICYIVAIFMEQSAFSLLNENEVEIIYKLFHFIDADIKTALEVLLNPCRYH